MPTIDPPYRFDPFQMPVNINWGAAPGGDYVLINFKARHVSGDYNASSPSGSSMAWTSDTDPGTECALTVAITQLFPGAQIVYQNTKLTITPHTWYYAFLQQGATLNVSTDEGVSCSGLPYDHDSLLAYLTEQTPNVESTTKIGYHTTLTHGGVFNQYTTAAAAADAASHWNAGGTGSLTAGGGYSEPILSEGGGPYTCFNMVILWLSHSTTSASYYDADLTVTYVIQLPFSIESPPPHPEIPGFAIHTTGYPWSVEVRVYPRQGIELDPSPTDPTFPLAWEHGVPLGPDGNPFAPFGTPSVRVKDAFLWDLYYEDLAGTGTATDYPFAIVVADHLTADPPPSPPDPMVRNSILQVYPTFVSPFTYFGEGSDWNVFGYADVPYGTSFYSSEWGDTPLTTPGPLPLIAADVPA